MKQLFLSFALFVSACATASAPPPTPPVSAALAAEFDAAIAHGMERLGDLAPGLSVAVYSRDGTYARGFGVTDVTTNERVTADTAIYIASSTKALTGLAFSILDQRGTLPLNTTLAAYAPDAPFPPIAHADQVTFQNLLTHTHGFENVGIAFRLAFSGDHDPDRLWRALGASTSRERAPLGTFGYTNVGYNVATILTDRKLGVRWQDLLQREIFGPAGMTHTTAYVSRAENEHWPLAEPHVFDIDANRVQRISVEKTDSTMQSAGGVVMSATDAARWLELMAEDGRIGGRQIIPAAAVQATRVARADLDDTYNDYKREHYGLGWYIGPYRDDTMLHSFGAFAGFRSHVSYIPARHVGVAAFTNTSSLATPIVDVVANYIYDRLAGRPDARASFDAAIETLVRRAEESRTRNIAERNSRAARPWLLSHPRAAYVGTYQNDAVGTISITAAGDDLTAHAGVLTSSVATPFTQPDTIRVEFTPGQGSVIGFEFGDGPNPVAMLFAGTRLPRRP